MGSLIALLAAGGLAAAPRCRAASAWLMLGACLVGFVAAAWASLAGSREVLALPIGLPGSALRVGLDPASAFFAVPVLGVGAALSAARDDRGPALAFAARPGLVVALLLVLLAADGFTLVLGIAATAALSWAVADAAGGGRPARLPLCSAGLGVVALAGAVALLAPTDTSPGQRLAFEAMRALPATGTRATLGFALALLGAGGLLGLAPLQGGLLAACRALPAETGALTAAAVPVVAIYVLERLLLDLSGRMTPAWWGAPLLVLGAASAVVGAVRANAEEHLRAVLAAISVRNAGLLAVAVGTALVARGIDLPALAASALGAAALLALAHAASQALLFLGAGAVERSAGTQSLGRLGGLVRTMPAVTATAFVGAASVAAAPLSAGFAGLWMLLQSLILDARVGGAASQVASTLAVGAVGLATALGGTAAVRLLGVAFLGRPRTPRAAAASEATRRERVSLAVLAAVLVLLGLVPAAGLALADGAVRALAGVPVPRAGVLAIGPQGDGAGYAPAGVLVLLVVAAGAAAWWLRLRAPGGVQRGPAWEGGGGGPPLWMPFGDPATEATPASLALPVLRLLGLVPWGERPVAAWRPPSARLLRRRVLAANRRCMAAVEAAERFAAREAPALLAAVVAILFAAAAIAGAL